MSASVGRAAIPAKTRLSVTREMVIGGCIAGLVDLGAACIINHLPAPIILRFIAGGLVGPSAATGGVATAVLGLILQVAMSILIAIICVNVARRVSARLPHWTLTGLAYGAATFIVMNYVVMPLSAVGRIPHFSPASFVENALAMLLFGLIIAFFSRPRQTLADTP